MALNKLEAEVSEQKQDEQKVLYNAVEIQKIIPHRYPFLLLDRVIELEDNKKVVAIKNVTIGESFFNGHFPGQPVMPGVLILEAMAQAGAILATLSSDGVGKGKTVFLVGASDFKWKRMVTPGDTLRIEMRSVRKRRPIWTMEGDVTVDGKLVTKGTLTAAEADYEAIVNG